MKGARPYWKVIVSLVFSLLATALVIGAGIELIRLFMPFVIGWLIACIANPVVCWLEKKIKIQKKLGSAIMIVVVLGLVIGLLYLLVSMLVREIGAWMVSLPGLYQDVVSGIKEIGENLSGIYRMFPKGIRHSWDSIVKGLDGAMGSWAAKISEPTVSMAGTVAKQIPTVIIGSFVTVLSAYFFVAERESVLAWIEKVTPKAIYERFSMALSNFKRAVGGYFVAQFKIMGVVCLILFVGLNLLKVEYAFVLTILIGFLDFLPFFGTGTVLGPWCVYALFTGDYIRALFLLVLYVVSQVVRQLIQPKLVGDEVGLKPLPTLVLIYIGYKLGGFLWMILSVPVGIILINMYKAGAFDYILDDVKILIRGILSLRQ